MQTPDIHALEELSDDAFWDLAFARAFPQPQRPQQPSQTAQDARDIVDTGYLLCDDAYALPLTALHEIIPMPQYFTLLPTTPSWMMGLIAWRGHILAAIDLHTYLTNQRHTGSNRSLLVTHVHNHLLAFAVTIEHTCTHANLPHDTHAVLDVVALFNAILQRLEKKTSDER